MTTRPGPAGPCSAVVIGGSAGGYRALQAILSCLPENLGLPVMVATHVAPGSGSERSRLLTRAGRLPVREPEDKEPILPGYVYLAPADYHLMVEPSREFSFSREERVSYSRPSIDVLFDSAAEVYRSGLVAVLLTGANHDGVSGLHTIKRFGGFTVVQDPATAEAPTMPQAAIDQAEIDLILPLSEIGRWLAGLSRNQESGP